MAKVTSKLQVTVPKVLADEYGIRPGDEVLWVRSGEAVRMVPARSLPPALSVDDKLALFDAATKRQRARQRGKRVGGAARDRGWTREDLYERARPR
ncbi:MAG: AbrB/MazE/SpoVT family DNA-binding domain-containing protein [Myxococcales bacterium]|nr:AbrB/MazE/SpoVT family DNA-binding domain-containing protein [Myxococcales bacterium]